MGGADHSKRVGYSSLRVFVLRHLLYIKLKLPEPFLTVYYLLLLEGGRVTSSLAIGQISQEPPVW
jgi:hypothetical protein